MELGASLDLDELLPLALERMRSAVGAEAGTLWMVDAKAWYVVVPGPARSATGFWARNADGRM